MTASFVFALVLAPVLSQTEPSISAPPPTLSDDAYQWLGPVITAGFGTSAVGDDLMGEAGAQAFALRHEDPRWLLVWSALAAAKGGVLGNQHPFTSFVGGHATADFELARRFQPAQPWSPYLSGRVAANLQILAHPGLPLAELNTINASDGVGGVSADGSLRVAGGFSLLDGTRSVLLFVFAQEALRAPGVVRPGAAFTEGGLGFRIDVNRQFSAALEAFGGFAPATRNSALNTTDQTFHLEAQGWLRKTFSNGLWFGVSLGIGRDSSHVVYLDSKTTFDSIHAPTFTGRLALGVALWRTP